MKTTIDLPDALVRQAKELARSQGVTMRELMVDGLRSEIEKRTARMPKVDFHFTTVEGEGLHPDVDPGTLTSRAYNLPS